MPTLQYINTGSGANTGDGDSLRSAFIKVNNNFSKINSTITNNLLSLEALPTIGDQPPSTFKVGYLWYNTNVGKLFIWNGSDWVDTAYYMPTYPLPTLNNTTPGQVLTVGNYGLPVWRTPAAGQNGTRWDAVPAEEGCPIYTELTSDYYNAYTQKSHLRLENTGNWDIGSDWNNNGVGSFDGSTLTLNALTGNIVLNAGYTNSWTFDSTGTLTLPTGYSIGGNTNGNDGIALTTDRGTILFGNHPECVPTLASHFHIMRDDPATVDLFFGDDYNYVKLPYYSTLTNVGVEINADGYSWQFDKSGLLTLPSGNAVIGSVFGSDGIIGSSGTSVAVFAQGSGGVAVLEWVENPENVGSSGTQVAAVIVNSPIASTTGTVQIVTGVATGPTVGNIWEFGVDGTLTIPDDIQDANGSVIRIVTTSTAPTRVNGQLWFNTIDGRAYIRYDNTWMDLSPTEVPAPSTYLDGLTISDTTISAVDTTGTVSIESGVNIWNFNTDGVTSLPNGQLDFNAPYSRFKDAVNTGVQLGSPDDQNYVNVDNTAVTIQVNSNGASGPHNLPQLNWTFDTHGVLSLPGDLGVGAGNGHIYIDDDLAGASSIRWVNLNPSSSMLRVWSDGRNDLNNQRLELGHDIEGGLYITTTQNVDGLYNNPGDDFNWTFGSDGILTMPPGNETTAGWIQWSHASNDLTNTAGIGFVDNYNIYTGLGLVAPTDTNAAKGIWFGTPADPTNPFRPETSMVFKGNSLYLPKNGYIKSHDIDYNGYPTIGNTGTSITIQTAITTSTQHNWVFGADGILTLPSGLTFSTGAQIFEQADHIGPSWASGLNIRGSSTNDPIRIYAYGGDSKGYNAAGITVNQHSVVIYSDSREPSSPGTAWNFGSDGTLTLPSGGGSGGGDEGAEIDFTKAPNSTLSGPTVILDQYVDKFRFFESTGTNRGAYIDLSQAAAGVGTLLNNRVSGFVNAGTFVTMDNIKATVTTSSNRGLSLATVSGTVTCFISGTFGKNGGFGGSSAGVELTTSASVSMFDWDFTSEGDSATYILNYGYTKSYRITIMIGATYNNNMITIERLV